MKEIRCPKDEWTIIVETVASRLPYYWDVTFTSAQGEPIEGDYVIERRFIIFLRTPLKGKLKSFIQFEQSSMDSGYLVKVRPKFDLMASYY